MPPQTDRDYSAAGCQPAEENITGILERMGEQLDRFAELQDQLECTLERGGAPAQTPATQGGSEQAQPGQPGVRYMAAARALRLQRLNGRLEEKLDRLDRLL